MPDDLARLDTRRPFTRADAIAAGLDPRLLRGSRFRRLFRGVYVDATVLEGPQLRTEAALKLFKRGAFASHASAARIHGVPIPVLPDEHISVLTPDDRRANPGVRCHVAPRSSQVMVRNDVRVSEYAQMFVELGTLLSLVDLVIVGDHLVRHNRLTVDRLAEFCVCSRLPGAKAARLAASYVRARVDSPMETRLRILIVLAGLPEPEVNRTVRTIDGEPLRRYDLSYPGVKVIIEYDGRQHIEREENWEADLDRREAIDDDAWRILVVTARGVFREPERTVLRIRRLLAQKRMPGLIRTPRGDWRPHFPARG
jgi:hypothetical protein